MKLLEALRNSVQRLESEIADSHLFDHMGDRGEFRERVIKSFLRPYLPKCYGLGSGAAFAADGTGSRQLDVVIYDDVFSNVLFRDSGNSLYPCESVYGEIEVKSRLDSTELNVAVGNIRSLKALHRSPSHMLDILPHRRLNTGEGLSFDKQLRNPYLGIIFAYDGLTLESTSNALNALLAEPQFDPELLPNFVFNYRRGFVAMRMTRDGRALKPVPPGSAYDKFVSVPTGSDTLPLFFLTVNVCLNELLLRSTDLNAYWTAVFDACIKARESGDEPNAEPEPPARLE
jgi:hypothetical protein